MTFAFKSTGKKKADTAPDTPRNLSFMETVRAASVP
jgi:hypothetical protein